MSRRKCKKREIFRKRRHGLAGRSIVLKASHPFGPVACLDVAGEGVETVGIEITMPIERPQLLEPNSADGPVQKSAVDRRIVPVQTDPPHFIAAGEVFRRPVIERRLIFGKWPDVVPKTIEENRYPVRRPDVDVPVVVAGVAARGPVAQPLIEPVAAVGAVLKNAPGREGIPAAFGQGLGGHRAKTHVQVVVLRPHHDRPAALARLALPAEALVKIAVPVRGEH